MLTFLRPSLRYSLEAHGFTILTGMSSTTNYTLEADGFVILPGPPAPNYDFKSDGFAIEKQQKVTHFTPRSQDQANGFTLIKKVKILSEQSPSLLATRAVAQAAVSPTISPEPEDGQAGSQQ